MRQRPYERLIAWKEADNLCFWIYEITKNFPSHELYGLTKQLRRASYSVPTNIAEGNARRGANDKAHFFEISISSLEEVHYQCKLAHRLKYITSAQLEDADDKIQRTGFLLMKLRSSVLSKSSVSSDSSESSDSL